MCAYASEVDVREKTVKSYKPRIGIGPRKIISGEVLCFFLNIFGQIFHFSTYKFLCKDGPDQASSLMHHITYRQMQKKKKIDPPVSPS